VLSALLVADVAQATMTTYKATLDAEQTTQGDPRSTSTATGTGQATFDDATMTLTGSVSFTRLTGPPTAIHIHAASCGIGGPVVEGLLLDGPQPSPVSFTRTLESDEATALVAGGLYFNIHTDAYPSEEIRGQILAASDTTTQCPRDPNSEPLDAGAEADADAAPDAGSPADAGAEPPIVLRHDHVTCDSGCALGAEPGSGGLLGVFGVGLSVVAAARQRRRTRR
jgi:hypothetical protein